MHAPNQQSQPDRPTTYTIKVQGKLKDEWADWFNGMTITCDSQGEAGVVTTLTGPVADQAALRGVLIRIWNLNLTLISVRYVATDGEKEEDND